MQNVLTVLVSFFFMIGGFFSYNLFAEENKDSCNVLFRSSTKTQDQSFDNLKNAVSSVEQDIEKLFDYYTKNSLYLDLKEVSAIYFMIRIMEYQISPSSRIQVLLNQLLNVESYDQKEKILIDAFEIKDDLASMMKDARSNFDLLKRDSFKYLLEIQKFNFKLYSKLDLEETLNLKKHLSTLSVSPLTGSIFLTGDLFFAVAFDLYKKNPVLKRILRDFELKYRSKENLNLVSNVIRSSIQEALADGFIQLVLNMDEATYLNFLKTKAQRSDVRNLIQNRGSDGAKIFFIYTFDERFRQIRLIQGAIINSFKKVGISGFSNIKHTLETQKVVDRIIKQFEFPEDISEDLISLILSLDIYYKGSSSGLQTEDIKKVYHFFSELDSISKIFFISYLSSNYMENDSKRVVLERFCSRLLVVSSDNFEKELIKELVLPKFEPYHKIKDVLLEALTRSDDFDIQM